MKINFYYSIKPLNYYYIKSLRSYVMLGLSNYAPKRNVETYLQNKFIWKTRQNKRLLELTVSRILMLLCKSSSLPFCPSLTAPFIVLRWCNRLDAGGGIEEAKAEYFKLLGKVKLKFMGFKEFFPFKYVSNYSKRYLRRN